MHDFEERLARATARIDREYFQLPVFGRESAAYRERQYCYELYHQLRQGWPTGGYHLSGEIDKSGHPVIRGNDLDNTKPDFLIHIPEDMDHNFAVLEVKPITGRLGGVKKDVLTLLAYLEHGQYERAFYLVYGEPSEGKALDYAKAQIIANKAQKRIDLWCHRAARVPAARVAF